MSSFPEMNIILDLRLIQIVLIACCASISYAASDNHQQTPWDPVPVYNNTYWTWRNSLNNKLIQDNIVSNKIKVIFLGDSITDLWIIAKWGKSVWDREYAPLGALNMGIGGDKTENVLWRVQHSNLSLLSNPPPKVIVLCIGTNNIGFYNATDDDISEGVGAIVTHLRETLPSTKILLLALFPRQTLWHFARVANINLKISRLDEEYLVQNNNNSSDVNMLSNYTTTSAISNISMEEEDPNSLGNGRMVKFLDMWTYFAESMGTVVPEYFAQDVLHLNTKGYEKWAKVMNHTLIEMMN